MKEKFNPICWDVYLYLSDIEINFLETPGGSAYSCFNKDSNVLFILTRALPSQNVEYIEANLYEVTEGQSAIHVSLGNRAYEELKREKHLHDRYAGPTGAEKITIFWGEPGKIEEIVSD
jgi:hypothetical protein